MVCKEDVFNLFKMLNPSKRIEVMCGLLHMCFPLELRFLGSCLENLARKDFNFLREAELKANSPVELGKVVDIHSEVSRARLLTHLALLHSTNHECANMVYNRILNCVDLSTRTLPMEPELAKELLLMMTMAANSPAFTFDQRQIICDHISTLKRIFYHYIYQEECNESCLHNQKPECDETMKETPKPIHITSIELTGHEKRQTDGHCEFNIQVTWSNSRVTTVSRTYQQLHDFHVQLVKQFPDEAGAHRQDRKIPFLHSGRCGGSSSDTDSEQNVTYVDEYTKALSSMPRHLIVCDHMINFFGPPPPEECINNSPSEMPGYSDNQFVHQTPAVHIQNPATSNIRPMFLHNGGYPVLCLPTPQPSPHTTRLPSPPLQQSVEVIQGSRSIEDGVRDLQLGNISPQFSKLGVNELLSLTDEQLESMGLVPSARHHVLTQIDNIKACRPVNGMVAFQSEQDLRSDSTHGTPPGPQYSDSYSDSLSSDYSPTESPRIDLGENSGKQIIGHIVMPQKSASVPCLPSHEDVIHIPQDMRTDIGRLHMLRPNTPTSPSVVNQRFLVRSPLRPGKPIVQHISPILTEPRFIHPAELRNISNVIDNDQTIEPVTCASVSVVTSCHMMTATSVSLSNYTAGHVLNRPNSLGDLDPRPHMVQPNMSYPPPPLLPTTVVPNMGMQPHVPNFEMPQQPNTGIPQHVQSADPQQLRNIESSPQIQGMEPLPHIHNMETPTHIQSMEPRSHVMVYNNQTGYNSDSGIFQPQYTSNVPANVGPPHLSVATHMPSNMNVAPLMSVAGYHSANTAAAYVASGQSYVQANSAISSYQFRHTPPPPINQPCSVCSQSHYLPVCETGQAVHYPAFIPTSNGLISPSIPNFNSGHLPNGLVGHMRGVPVSGFYRQHKRHVMECYNCGQRGHRGSECKHQSMDRMTYGGMFHMKYVEEDSK